MSVSDILDVDGLRVGPCMVRGYIERIAKLEQERDNALAMMGKWMRHEGHVCPSCGMPDDNMQRLKERIAELERQADCPYTHMIDDICTKCGWQGREALGKEIEK